MMFAGCGSQLRKPFCKDALSEFPDSMIGTYTVTMPKVDPGMNYATTFTEQTIEIKKTGIAVPEVTGLVAEGNWIGGNRLCKIGEHLYAEKINENSTYTITRIEATQYGLAFSDLSFPVEELKARNINFVVVPNLELIETPDTRWTKVMSLGTNPLIVDNSNVSIEELIKISKRVSLFITMNRVKPKEKSPAKFVSLQALQK